MICSIIAQADGFPLKELISLTSGGGLAVIVWLFATDKICTTASAQRQIEREIVRANMSEARAERCERQREAALALAYRGLDIAESASKGST